MRQTHLWSSVVISAISLLFLFYIIPTQTSPPGSPLDLEPSFIPSLAITVTLILAIIMGATAFFSRKSQDEEHEEFGAESSGMGWIEFKNLGLWILVSLFAWFGTTYVGFEPTMTVLLAAGLYFAGVRNYWLMAIIAVATPIILSLGAWHIFTAELPAFWRN